MITTRIAFKHIPMGVEFKHKDIEYTKTNLQRGYYHKNGRKVLKFFKKSTVVETTSEYFDV